MDGGEPVTFPEKGFQQYDDLKYYFVVNMIEQDG